MWQNEESQNSIISSTGSTTEGEHKRVRRRTEFGLAAGYVLHIFVSTFSFQIPNKDCDG